jgi:hypothetical protein
MRESETLISEGVSAGVLVQKNPLLIPIISSVFSVESLLIILDYQQCHTYSGSETISDDSVKPL